MHQGLSAGLVFADHPGKRYEAVVATPRHVRSMRARARCRWSCRSTTAAASCCRARMRKCISTSGRTTRCACRRTPCCSAPRACGWRSLDISSRAPAPITQGRDFGTEIEVLSRRRAPNEVWSSTRPIRSAMACRCAWHRRARRQQPAERTGMPDARSAAGRRAAAARSSGCSLAPHYERPATPTAGGHLSRKPVSWKVADARGHRRRAGPWWRCFRTRNWIASRRRSPTPTRACKAAFAQLDEAHAADAHRRARAGSRRSTPTRAQRASASRSIRPTTRPGKPATATVHRRRQPLLRDRSVRARAQHGGQRALQRAGQRRRRRDAGSGAARRARHGLLHAARPGCGAAAARPDGRRLRPRAAADAEPVQGRRLAPVGRAAGAGAAQTARTQAEDTRLRRAQTEHAIAVLVGREPSSLQPRAAPCASASRRCRRSIRDCPPSCSSAVPMSPPPSGAWPPPMPTSA